MLPHLKRVATLTVWSTYAQKSM